MKSKEHLSLILLVNRAAPNCKIPVFHNFSTDFTFRNTYAWIYHMLNSKVSKILQALLYFSVCNVYECVYLTSLAIKSNRSGKAIGEVEGDISALSYEHVLLSSSSLSLIQ